MSWIGWLIVIFVGSVALPISHIRRIRSENISARKANWDSCIDDGNIPQAVAMALGFGPLDPLVLESFKAGVKRHGPDGIYGLMVLLIEDVLDKERREGRNHPAVAEGLERLADFYEGMNIIGATGGLESILLRKRARKIRDRRFAAFLLKSRNTDDSATEESDALNGKESPISDQDPVESPEHLYSLARQYRADNHFDEAEHCLVRAITNLEQILGLDRPGGPDPHAVVELQPEKYFYGRSSSTGAPFRHVSVKEGSISMITFTPPVATSPDDVEAQKCKVLSRDSLTPKALLALKEFVPLPEIWPTLFGLSQALSELNELLVATGRGDLVHSMNLESQADDLQYGLTNEYTSAIRHLPMEIPDEPDQ
jgi:hypothetical protein